MGSRGWLAGLLCTAVAAAGACGSDGASGQPVTQSSASTVIASQPTIERGTVVPAGPLGPHDVVASVTQRDTSPGADGGAVNALVAGTNGFAVDLFRQAVGPPTQNAVVGNHSISTALLLTMAGANPPTTDAIAEMLGVAGVAEESLHPAANALDLILEGRSGDGLELSIANKLFVADGLELRDRFLDVAMGDYGAPVAAVDFARDEQGAVDAVNAWVSDATDGFIDQLADRYAPETVVVLANAMYLQAKWAVQFHRSEGSGLPFTRSDGSVVEVDSMRHDEYLPLFQSPGLSAVELPYVGGNLSMVVIQPTDLAAFEASLTAAQLGEITAGLAESGIHLTMPIWSTKTSVEALQPLHALGLPETYDFGAMFVGGERGYFIDQVSHVARIEVDETGTTAAAATEVAIAASHGPTVTIDRPFFYLVRDRGSGAILFLGHVVDPSA
jgi:serpin B